MSARPGGWVPGIGWVARADEVHPNDRVEFVDTDGWVGGVVHLIGEVPPGALFIVTRWADGSTPSPSPVESEGERECVHPSEGLAAWFRLAVQYEHARLGNDMTEQTSTALERVLTFLLQPAQVYNPASPPEGSVTVPPTGDEREFQHVAWLKTMPEWIDLAYALHERNRVMDLAHQPGEETKGSIARIRADATVANMAVRLADALPPLLAVADRGDEGKAT